MTLARVDSAVHAGTHDDRYDLSPVRVVLNVFRPGGCWFAPGEALTGRAVTWQSPPRALGIGCC